MLVASLLPRSLDSISLQAAALLLQFTELALQLLKLLCEIVGARICASDAKSPQVSDQIL